jgi:ribosome-associated toxin RatA of RatAB toxin-antitoxin module
MKKFNVSSLTLVAFLLFSSTIFAQDWVKKVDKNDVVVYVRDVKGSSFKEFKGETIVKASLSTLVSLVDDHESYPNWMYNCKEAKLLKRVSRTEGYNYTLTTAPWPVSDRDVITHFVLNQDLKTKRVTIDLKGEKDFIKETSNVRVSSLKGKWEFTPLGNGDVKVVYQLHTEPNGSIPASIANSFVVDLPNTTLKNLRNEIKKPKYANAKIKELEELN